MSSESCETYRNPALIRTLLVTTAVMAVICWTAFSREVGAVVFGTVVLIALAAFRVRLIAYPDGVRVVNYFRSFSLAWDEVARVVEDEWMGSGPLCVIRLRTGEDIRAWGLYGGTRGLGASSIRTAINDLERRRTRHH